MTRWKASAIHLALSILVLSIIAAVLVWRWYPPGLFQMAKADKLFMVIAAVDVVVGPLLTLVVYKQGKKSLKSDLAVIALLQLAAMGYGLHTVWASRPVYLVASVDRFQLVFANELDPSDLLAAPPEFQRIPMTEVRIIGTLQPKDAADRLRIVLSAAEGKDIHLMPARYVAYEKVAKDLAGRAIPARELAAGLASESRERLLRALGSTKHPEFVLAVPIDSARGSATMLLSRTGETLGPISVDPWPVISGRKRITAGEIPDQ